MAVPISELVRAGIDKLRLKLLDLTNRNRLLNFKFTDSSKKFVRVVDELPDVLYRRLSDDTEPRKLFFAALPEPPDEDDAVDEAADAGASADDLLSIDSGRPQERRRAKESRKRIDLAAWARENGIDPSYDLPLGDQRRASHHDTTIQTLLLPDDIERKLSAIRDDQRLAQQELGVSSLYVAFGYLQWYEADSSEEERFAPILLLPVEIDRQLSRHRYDYFIQGGEGAEPTINITLKERLRNDFGFAVPEFQEDETPDTYLGRFAQAIAQMPRWQVRRFVVIGHFSFSRLVMYMDLQGEKWQHQPLEENPLISSLLAGTAPGVGSSPGDLAETLDVDSPEVEKHVPVLITDADSSQFAAIAAAMSSDQRSFALKGPPGTGKSQTITNLIASALAHGKRVLFVAEKMAALSVVADRLEEAGLGDFLLELHSTKSHKKTVLESFSTRLKHRTSGSDEKLAESVASLRKARDELKRYVDLMNTSVGLSGETLHAIHWKEQRARRLLGSTAYAHIRVLADRSAPNLTKDDLQARCDVLRQFGADLKRCIEVTGSLDTHPLRGADKPAGHFNEHSVTGGFHALKKVAEKVAAVAGHVSKATHAPFPDTIEGIRHIADGMRKLPPPSTGVDLKTLSLVRTKADIKSLDQLAQDLATLIKYLDRLRSVFSSVSDVLPEALTLSAAASSLSRALPHLHVDDHLISALPEPLELQKQRLTANANVLNTLQHFWNASGLSGELTSGQLVHLLKAIALLRDTQEKVLRARTPQLFAKDIAETIQNAKAHADKIKGDLAACTADLRLETLPAPEQLRAYASSLRQANALTALLSKECRAARRLFRQASRSKGRTRADIANTYDRAAAALTLRNEFIAESPIKPIAGTLFKGLDTPYDLLTDVNQFAAAVRASFSGFDAVQKPIQQLLLQGDADLLAEIASNVSREGSDQLVKWLTEKGKRETGTPAQLVAQDLSIAENAAKDLETLKRVALVQDLLVSKLTSELVTAVRLATDVAHVTGSDLYKEIVTCKPYPGQADLDGLNVTLSYAKYIVDLQLPQAMQALLLSPKYQAALHALSQFGALLASALSEFDAHIAEMHSSLGLSLELWLRVPSTQVSAHAVIQKAEQAGALSLEAITEWSSLCRAREDAAKYGIRNLVDLLERGVVDPCQADEAYRAVYYRSLIVSVAETVKEFPKWTGEQMTQVRARLASLDKAYIQASCKWLAWKLSKTPVPPGNAYGAVSQKTELALIEWECGKQRGHRPLRELLSRAGAAARALKPCFMMSPASVAQFLDPKFGGFDLMIVDEASQMRPEEAIGSVARAAQAIVVGDPMQLPPTSFFDGVQDTIADDEQEYVDIDTESVLDQALSSWRPHRELNWHYRSRHHSLIAFSNKEFYGNRLVVFPSPAAQSARFGIEHHHVEKATYASSLNPLEGEAVVKHVRQLIRLRPESSIGVVAVNQAQCALLKEHFDREFAEHDELEKYRARWHKTLGEFFVKNLENVQGDERDIIVISTVYGPAEIGGKVAQRFGPINSKNGHRRLNVLFTRAREKVVLVTSLRPEDILAEKSAAPGVRAFKGFLEYARSGRLETGVIDETRPPGSPFEEEVIEVIRELGHEAQPQVGVAGYFIDIAVRHPLNRDHFMLGIECDGATYHSAKSARDRDRLREEVLGRLHWQLHRIWSTDWFHNRDREVKRLDARIKQAVGLVA